MGFAKMYQPLPSHLHVLLRLTWGMRWHRRHARAHRCTGPERSLICSDHPWRWKRSGVTWGNQCWVTNVHQMLTTGFYDSGFFFPSLKGFARWKPRDIWGLNRDPLPAPLGSPRRAARVPRRWCARSLPAGGLWRASHGRAPTDPPARHRARQGRFWGGQAKDNALKSNKKGDDL